MLQCTPQRWLRALDLNSLWMELNLSELSRGSLNAPHVRVGGQSLEPEKTWPEISLSPCSNCEYRGRGLPGTRRFALQLCSRCRTWLRSGRTTAPFPSLCLQNIKLLWNGSKIACKHELWTTPVSIVLHWYTCNEMQMSVHKISVTGRCLVSVGLVFLKEQDYSRYMHMLLFT